MPFCSNCGTRIPDDTKFCPSCGSTIPTQNSAQQAFQQSDRQNQGQTNEQDSRQKKSNFFADLNNTADTTSQHDPADIESHKVLCVFAYLGIFFLIPLLAAPNSKYARFHVGQGFNLFLLSLITLGISRIWFFGEVLSFIFWICQIVLFIIGIVNVVHGRAKELPVIGRFKIFN